MKKLLSLLSLFFCCTLVAAPDFTINQLPSPQGSSSAYWGLTFEEFEANKSITLTIQRPAINAFIKGCCDQTIIFCLDANNQPYNPKSKKLTPITLTSNGFLPGELICVICTQGSKQVAKSFHPFPLLALDPQGQPFFEIELQSPTAFLLLAPFIAPTESYTVTFTDGSTSLTYPQIGPLQMIFSPAFNSFSGRGQVTLNYANHTYTLPLFWGDALTPYLKPTSACFVN